MTTNKTTAYLLFVLSKQPIKQNECQLSKSISQPENLKTMRRTLVFVLSILCTGCCVQTDTIVDTCSSKFDFDETVFLALLRIERKMEGFEKRVLRLQKHLENNENSRHRELSKFLYETKRKIADLVQQLSVWQEITGKGIKQQKTTNTGKIHVNSVLFLNNA